MKRRFSTITSVLCTACVATSALAGSQQLQLAFQPVAGAVTSGFFPVPVSPANLSSVSGTIQLFQGAPASTFFSVDVNQTGFQSPGQVVNTLDASIIIDSGLITGAFFSVVMNDGSFFQAVGGSGGSGLDLSFTSNAYTISGAITNFQMSGPTLAGVDVTGPFNAQPLFGSFFDFSFTPTPIVTLIGNTTFADFDTQLLMDVSSPVVVPLPAAVSLGTVGLIALAGRRRRTI